MRSCERSWARSWARSFVRDFVRAGVACFRERGAYVAECWCGVGREWDAWWCLSCSLVACRGVSCVSRVCVVCFSFCSSCVSRVCVVCFMCLMCRACCACVAFHCFVCACRTSRLRRVVLFVFVVSYCVVRVSREGRRRRVLRGAQGGRVAMLRSLAIAQQYTAAAAAQRCAHGRVCALALDGREFSRRGEERSASCFLRRVSCFACRSVWGGTLWHVRGTALWGEAHVERRAARVR